MRQQQMFHAWFSTDIFIRALDGPPIYKCICGYEVRGREAFDQHLRDMAQLG